MCLPAIFVQACGWIAGISHSLLARSHIEMLLQGAWVKGKKCGQGVFIFHSGDVYEGDFKDDDIQGKGAKNFVNGDLYVVSKARLCVRACVHLCVRACVRAHMMGSSRMTTFV